MKMPIGEILDRYSIAILKKERASAENQQEIDDLTQEIESYKETHEEFINEKIDKLIEINGMIWDLESDIRKGREGELGLEEVGRRAIKIREFNKIRVGYKNDVVEVFGEGYKDIKMNHASSNG
jgi:hypothetical protein